MLDKQHLIKKILEAYPSLTEAELYDGKQLTQLSSVLLRAHKFFAEDDETVRYNSMPDSIRKNILTLDVYCENLKQPAELESLLEYLKENDTVDWFIVRDDKGSYNYWNARNRNSTPVVFVPKEIYDASKADDYDIYREAKRKIGFKENNIMTVIIGGNIVGLRDLMSDQAIAKKIQDKILQK